MTCSNCKQQMSATEWHDIMLSSNEKPLEMEMVCPDCYKAIKTALQIRKGMIHPPHNLGYNPYQE